MEIAKKIDEMGTAFEEYKKANDKRLEEIKATGRASAETEAKLVKVETDMSALEKKITDLNAALARTGGQGGAPAKDELKEKKAEYKAALSLALRKGIPLSEEMKNFAYTEAQRKSAGLDFDVKTTALSVDSEADGGFLVTPEVSSEIVTKVFESSPVRQLASVQTISTSSLKINEDLDEAESGWVGERATRTQTSTPQVKMIEIMVHELYSNPYATQAFLDDAAVNVEAWLGGKVSEKFARDEATAFVNGTGVGKPKGILQYAAGSTFGLIETGTCATINEIGGYDLIDLQGLLKEPYQPNSTWLMNRLMIGIIRKLKESTGQYIWQPGLQAGVPNTLLGRPVMMASDMPAALGTNSQILMYGDFKAGYQIVDRVGIRVLRDPYSAKPYTTFYTTKRVGGGVKNFEAIKVLKSQD